MNIVCIVPTLNRHDDVFRLSESFNSTSKHQSINFEIILVDNSVDANCKHHFNALDFGFKANYIHEPKPGLSNARNAAIKAAKDDVDYFCTIDDDIIIPSDFLDRLEKVIKNNSTSPIIGGRVELYNELDLPVTIKTSTKFQEYDGIALFGFIFGCAMLIKSSVFKDVGLFDPNLGAGTKNGGSEDSDLIYRTWEYYKRKLPIVYDPFYYVYHNHGRREEEYTTKLLENYARGQGGFFAKQILFKRQKYILKILWWELVSDWNNKRLFKRKWKCRFNGFLTFSLGKK